MTDRYAAQRRALINRMQERGIRDLNVLRAFELVHRHNFVPQAVAHMAYDDAPVPIGFGQTASQPSLQALYMQLLEIGADDRVLEVGTGSGYQTAILALLARRVFSLERVPELAHQAIQRMRELHLLNVKIQAFDGTVGWSEVAPFDRIIVAAAAPSAPQPLLEQLATKGRLLIPEGDRRRQTLVLYERTARSFRRRELDSVAFVPLVGRFGWEREDEGGG